MKIRINTLLKEKLPNFSVIAYTMDVENNKTSTVEEMLKNLKVDFAINEVTSNPLVNLTLATFLSAEFGFLGVVV